MQQCKLCKRKITNETAKKFDGMGEVCAGKVAKDAKTLGYGCAIKDIDVDSYINYKFKDTFLDYQIKWIKNFFNQAKDRLAIPNNPLLDDIKKAGSSMNSIQGHSKFYRALKIENKIHSIKYGKGINDKLKEYNNLLGELELQKPNLNKSTSDMYNEKMGKIVNLIFKRYSSRNAEKEFINHYSAFLSRNKNVKPFLSSRILMGMRK